MGLKAAVFGSGFMGRVHTEALRRLGNVEVVHVSSRDPKAVAEAMADRSITAVHICTPNASHYALSKAALEAGKHVMCEKPLTTSVAQAAELVELAKAKGLRNATCHNLRYYPMVQQIRRLREAGEFGEILIAQGTYSQDWLLYDTDWNWRIDTEEAGASRALADIGSHWCDMTEHLTGLRITELCADLQTFHKIRKKPAAEVESFGKSTGDTVDVAITSEDFAAVMLRLGDRARGSFTVSQVSAGRKNRLSIEIYGTKGGAAWDQERPDELWLGRRDGPNGVMVKDPGLLMPGAQSYADLPGGHSEGYDDTFKQVFRRFYKSIEAGGEPEYPQFADGLRQLKILDAELASSAKRNWVTVSA